MISSSTARPIVAARQHAGANPCPLARLAIFYMRLVPPAHPNIEDTEAGSFPSKGPAVTERKMSTLNRATLLKVLEILNSAHAGEALAAAKLASNMVSEAGLTWDEVLSPHIQARASQASGRPAGTGPFGYRRDRDLSAHEQFFMVLLSPRT